MPEVRENGGFVLFARAFTSVAGVISLFANYIRVNVIFGDFSLSIFPRS